MNRRLLLVAFLSTLALTILAAGHQLTNAAPNMAPPPQHAPSIALVTTSVTPTWQVVTGGGGKANYLADVSVDSPTDGWAVGSTGPGSYGVLMHYDGATWRQTGTPTGTYNLNAVAMISPTEGWAVGYNACNFGTCDSNLLMHYTQAGWQRAPAPPSPGRYGYYDIDIKGSAGWIVGNADHFLQFNGSSWTPITAPSFEAHAVSVVDAAEAWAVGSAPTVPFRTNIAHWIGGTWSLVTPTYNLQPDYHPLLLGVNVSDAGEGWAVGSSRYSRLGRVQYQCLIVHYVSGTWVQAACPSVDVRLRAVAMRSSNDVWAVGRKSATPEGVIYHYNGSTWMTATTPSGTPNLNSVELVGANDGWIVGDGGTILRLVNGTWTRVQGSSLYVGPISAVSGNEVWYGGLAGQLYRWQNGTVTQFTGPLTTSVQMLDMISPTLGWGVIVAPPPRRGNSVFRYSNGTWMWMPNMTAQAIDMIGPDEGWIGQDCGVWHDASGTWTYQSGPHSYGYGATSLSMLDSNLGWAVSGICLSPTTTVLTYTNGTWAPVTPTMTFPGLYQVLKVIGISPGEAWVAGYSMSCTAEECPISAELHHFAGGAWTSFPLPDWCALLDIGKVSATEWWAAGKLKTLEYAFLHYKDGAFTTVSAAGEDVQQVSMLPDGSGFASGVGSLLRLIDLPNKVYLPLIRR